MRLSSSILVKSFSILAFLAVAPGCDGGSDTAGVGGNAGSGGAGGSGAAGGNGGAGGADFVPAEHPPFPVIKGDTNYVVSKPELVTITFQGYSLKSQVEAAGDQLVTSDWQAEIGPDYGVGAGTHVAKVVLPMAPPAQLTETELLDMIDQEITNGVVPAPTANTIYMIYVDPSTEFDDGFGYLICNDYFGYHWQNDMTNGTLTWAVVGECGGGIDEVTATFAHEYIEAASDPGEVGGFYMQLSPTDPWYCLEGYENADICDYNTPAVEAGFTYQRVWSNTAAAAAVSSPCAPVDPNDVFYNVFSDQKAIPEVAPGESATFTLTGWSMGPLADWDLDYDASYYSEVEPTVAFSDTKINNGKTVTITLTVPAGAPSGALATAMVYSGPGYDRFFPVSVWTK